MKDLFLKLFETSKAEGKLISIRTDIDDVSRFAAGYIQEYDDTMVYLRSIDPEGNDDGYTYIKTEEIYQVDYNNRYLKRLQLLIGKKAELITPTCIVERKHDENYLISLIKKAIQDNLIISINSINDYSLLGYVKEMDDSYLQFQVITDDGDDDGITVIRIEDIERIYIAGRDQKKVEVFYNNKSLLL